MGNAITGREVVAALKRGASWGTAVACGAGDGVLLKSIGIKNSPEIIHDDSMGLLNYLSADLGKTESGGSIETYVRYDGMDLVYALVMGASGIPAQQGETAAYANTFDLAADTDGLFATFAHQLKSDVVVEYPSVKITGITIKGEINTPLEASIEVQADRAEYGSSINTSLAGVTCPEAKNRVIMSSGSVFRLNRLGDAALADSDMIYPKGFELSVKRASEGDYGPGRDGMSEPVQTDKTEVTLKLDFPRYDDRTHLFLAGLTALDEYKCDLTFTGSPIAENCSRSLRIMFPRLIANEASPELGGPGKITGSVTLRGYQPDSAPAGMDDVRSPMRISVCNQRAASPLD